MLLFVVFRYTIDCLSPYRPLYILFRVPSSPRFEAADDDQDASPVQKPATESVVNGGTAVPRALAARQKRSTATTDKQSPALVARNQSRRTCCSRCHDFAFILTQYIQTYIHT
jgi:hypothetical protein